MIEEFKDIPEYEGLYQVSNLGNVKSFKNGIEKVLKGGISSSGYRNVVLYNGSKLKGYSIHQLVAIEFLNHKPLKYKIVVDHINNNKLDNRLENLQIISNRANLTKDKKKGTSKYVGVNLDKTRNKWISQITINGKNVFLGRFKTEIEASEAYQNKLKTL
jgi:hypothetical protein